MYSYVWNIFASVNSVALWDIVFFDSPIGGAHMQIFHMSTPKKEEKMEMKEKKEKYTVFM